MRTYSHSFLKFYFKKLFPMCILSFLCSVLLTSLMIVKDSYDMYQINLSKKMYGDWDICYQTDIFSITPEIEEWVHKNVNVSYYKAESDFKFNDIPNLSLSVVSNFNGFKQHNIEGRFPKSSDEILFDKNIDESIKVGTYITLNNDSDKKNFKVVGLYRGLVGLPNIYTFSKNIIDGTVYGYLKSKDSLNSISELIQINHEVVNKKYKVTPFDYTYIIFFSLVLVLVLILITCICKLFCLVKYENLVQLQQLGFISRKMRKMIKYELFLLSSSWMIFGFIFSMVMAFIILNDLFYVPLTHIIFFIILLFFLHSYIIVISHYFLKHKSNLKIKKKKCPILKSETWWLTIVHLIRLPFVNSIVVILLVLCMISGISIYYTESWLNDAKMSHQSDRVLSINFMISDHPSKKISEMEKILEDTEYDSTYIISTVYGENNLLYDKESKGEYKSSITLSDYLGQPTQTVIIENGVEKEGDIYVSEEFINQYPVVIQGEVVIKKCSNISSTYNALKLIESTAPDYIYVMNDYESLKEFNSQALILRLIIYGYIFILTFVGFFMLYSITLLVLRNNEKNIRLLYVLGLTQNELKKICFMESICIVAIVGIISILVFSILNFLKYYHILLWMVLGFLFILLSQINFKKVMCQHL